MINWLSNLYSFSCHHPTIAGAAAKQLQNITLLIIVKPKCLFTKTSFTQQIVIFSFQISFILNFFLCFIKIWNWNIMPFIMISSHLWLVHSYHCLVCMQMNHCSFLTQDLSSYPSSFVLELTGILMPVKYFITLFLRSIRWHCSFCHIMSQISCLSCFLMCSQCKTL